MTVLDRFLNYVSFETTAGEEKPDRCSDEKMLLLADSLMQELFRLHPDSISINRFGVIDCHFKGDENKKAVAFLAHMDTSPQASGKNVRARVVKYEGQDIVLSEGRVLSEKEFPHLRNAVGHPIVVTDGTTLLGGDDKAGIAIIMTALTDILKKEGHRPIEVIFTTDEEIGADAEHVSMELCSSEYGYTVDGGDYRLIAIESFTAYAMDVHVIGKSIHPGSAKNKLVNASEVLMRFHEALPHALRPEHTEGKEPFYHLCSVRGSEDSAAGEYIIRSFSEDQMKSLIELARFTARRINEELGYPAISLKIREQYHNMKNVLDKYPAIQKEMESVYEKLGIDYEYEAIRGGTTGSQLSFKGLPCPNIGTGDYNCHGQYEYVDVFEMERMVDVVRELMIG